MFLARTDDEQGRPIIGVGLRTEDLQRLVAGRPMSFALGDAQIHGRESQERVLVAFARPHEVEQLRNGYFPGLTDARVLIYVEHETLKRLTSGGHLNIQTPGTPVARFIVFCGTGPRDAIAAFRQAGIHARIAGPPVPLTGARLDAITATTAAAL